MASQPIAKKRPWRTSFEQTQHLRTSSRASSSGTYSQGPRRVKVRSLAPSDTSSRSITASASRSQTPVAQSQPSRSSRAPSSSHQTPTAESLPPRSSRAPSSARQAPARDEYQAETEEEIESREQEDSIHEVVMAIDIRGRDTVGCCFYVAREEKLSLLNDVMYGGVDIISTLKDSLEPTTVLISDRIDEKVDDILDPQGIMTESSEEGSRLPYEVKICKASEFNYEDGKRRLADLNIRAEVASVTFATPGNEDVFESYNAGLEPGFTGATGKLLQLSTLIDFDSRLSIGCASAVLDHLQARRAQMFIPGDDRAYSVLRVESIEMFSMSDMMYLNQDTLAALQIMESESHPHAQNQGPNNTGSKESLSVFGLFHLLARSPQGKQRLRSMFLRPSLDLAILSQRHQSIGTFLRTSNTSLVRDMITALKSIKNMRPVMVHLRKGISGSADRHRAFKCNVWTTIRAFAFHTLGIRSAVSQMESIVPLDIVTKIIETFEPQKIALVGRDIEEMVDFRTSSEENRTVINEGIDEDLDAARRTYAGIEDLLSQLSEEVIQDFENPSEPIILNVVTYPQIGFLIGVQKDPGSERFPAPPLPRPDRPAWERIFTSENALYYKDSRMHALDQRFGDIVGNIHDREIELAFELGQRTLEHENLFCEISDICGELDSLLALAQGANAYKLIPPDMVIENVLEIVGGRHLVQEHLSSNFIANDTILGGGTGSSESEDTPMSGQAEASDATTEYPSMIMLTGPNHSGKSVYLKQVALIVFLAHVGSFVPAQKAIIGLTDKILTRVSTRETVSKQHSAFMIDLQQMSSALNMSTPRSLLILDEFGKGTEAADGAGLACAVFEHFLELGNLRPKVVAATHFHEIFENGFLNNFPNLAFFHMEVNVDRNASIENQVTYLYELKPGRSIASFGTVCAAMNGVGPDVVERATDIVRLQARGDLLAPHENLSERDKVHLAQAEELGRQFLMQDFGTTHGAPSSDPRTFLAALNFDWDSSSTA